MSADHTWRSVLGALLAGADLTERQAAWAMGEILSDAATTAQIAGFAVALRAKGETVEELRGLVGAMYEHVVPISVDRRAVDVVGTGGDGAHTVNISTMAALVAAGTGATVVKHGNRSASSLCGAADLVEALGVPLDLEPRRVAEQVSGLGIGFCFAPRFHPALRFAAQARSELSVPTVFNVLGPLANPARPAAQAVGVADPRLAELIAGVFATRGVDAVVFRGDDGLDELTTATSSRLWVVRDSAVSEERLHPADLGMAPSPSGALRGGDASFNAKACERVLGGEAGPVRDTVLLNAAAALTVYHQDDAEPGAGFVERMRRMLPRATEAIDSGAAAGLLERWVAASR